MKTKTASYSRLLAVILFFGIAQDTLAEYPKTDFDFLALPEFCMATQNQRLQGSALQKRWLKRIEGFDGPHHYCAGLFTYNLALKIADKGARNYKLSGALNELVYPYNHHFNPNHPLSSHLLYDIARVHEDMEDYKTAIEFYRKSIELNQKSWLTYASLSDLLVKLNMTKDAIDLLQNGLQHKPESKPLLKRLAKLKK